MVHEEKQQKMILVATLSFIVSSVMRNWSIVGKMMGSIVTGLCVPWAWEPSHLSVGTITCPPSWLIILFFRSGAAALVEPQRSRY